MDKQTIGVIIGVVIAVTIVLYIYDRRTKQLEIDMLDAVKLAIGAGTIAGGVTYAVGTDNIPDISETITKASQMTQEMFVGKPEF